jgi:hypothetical protein
VKKTPAPFLLRLATSLRAAADTMAAQEQISLNQFINLAVAEKVTRMQLAFQEREKAGDSDDDSDGAPQQNEARP